MQRLEVSGAVRPIYGSLGVKRLIWTRLFYKNNSTNLQKDVDVELFLDLA